MASTGRYLSVLKKPQNSGENLSLKLSQFNMVESSFTVDIAVDSTMSESDMALAIKDALNTAFQTNNCLYQGIPNFSVDGYPPFTLISVVCDHIVHVWSQVGFKMEVVQADTATTAIYQISDDPVFPLLQDALDSTGALGIGALNGLSDDAVALACAMASRQVIRYLTGFKVAASTYLQEVRGNWTLGFRYDVPKVLYEDRPVVRGPFLSFLFDQSNIAPIIGYDVDYKDGFCSFPDYGSYQRQPLDLNNVLRQTYVAGFPNVPDVCKDVCAQIMGFMKYSPAIETLKQGSFMVKYRDLQAMELSFQIQLNSALGI